MGSLAFYFWNYLDCSFRLVSRRKNVFSGKKFGKNFKNFLQMSNKNKAFTPTPISDVLEWVDKFWNVFLKDIVIIFPNHVLNIFYQF